MHVALCKAVARLAPATTVAMRVLVTDRINRAEFEKTVQFQRGTGNETRVEFDSGWGTYRIALSVPKYQCSAVEFMQVLKEHNRALQVTLLDRNMQLPAPVIVAGTLPVSYSYAAPDIVMFPKAIKCDAPVSDPQTTGVDSVLEPDGYYSEVRARTLYTNPNDVTLAVRMKDSSGGFHYIRIPWKWVSGYQWPSVALLNVDDALIDYAAGQPEDTLLCPKFFSTTEG